MRYLLMIFFVISFFIYPTVINEPELTLAWKILFCFILVLFDLLSIIWFYQDYTERKKWKK